MDIYNIDLHYHAGQERSRGVSLRDYLEHARITGRKVLGLTDHLGRYSESKKRKKDRPRPYAKSVEGLKQYRRDVAVLEDEFSDIHLFFCPEISPGDNLSNISDEVVEVSDFFIFEPPYPQGSVEENTEAFLTRMGEVSDFCKECGKDGFIAHPFRSPVNYRMIKRGIEPWITAISPRDDGNFSSTEVKDFFLLDLEAVGEAADRLGIPLEINGNTQKRILGNNMPAPLQLLYSAFRVLRDRGADFVPGSDQHGFWVGTSRVGGFVPQHCFEDLGLDVTDLRFVQKILSR